jgi:hypothetical protein
MINSHLLYRLSYRGTIQLLPQHRFPVVQPVRCAEARHFTFSRSAVNPLNCFYSNDLQNKGVFLAERLFFAQTAWFLAYFLYKSAP